MPFKQGRTEAFVTREWMRRGWFAILLWPVSLLFSMLVRIRRALFAIGLLKSIRLPVPVIVVGNIFIGGTGKTPFTIWLVSILKQAGYRPGVISRGYRSEGEQVRVVTEESMPQEAGDEPVLIALHGQCPVMVGRNRVDVAHALLKAHPEINVIVSDDGLQHYAMKRDMEIMLFDSRAVGNGWMLPAGPLREPASRRCDFTIYNLAQADSQPDNVARRNATTFRMQLIPGKIYKLLNPSQDRDLHEIADLQKIERGLRVTAAAGIGNPARYFSMLTSKGLAFEAMPLPDHFDFADNPFRELAADIILITEKDAVKCRQVEEIKNDPRLWVVPVIADIDSVLAEKIVENLRGYTIV